MKTKRVKDRSLMKWLWVWTIERPMYLYTILCCIRPQKMYMKLSRWSTGFVGTRKTNPISIFLHVRTNLQISSLPSPRMKQGFLKWVIKNAKSFSFILLLWFLGGGGYCNIFIYWHLLLLSCMHCGWSLAAWLPYPAFWEPRFLRKQSCRHTFQPSSSGMFPRGGHAGES